MERLVTKTAQLSWLKNCRTISKIQLEIWRRVKDGLLLALLLALRCIIKEISGVTMSYNARS